MIDRRSLFTAAGATLVGSAVGARSASAAQAAYDIEPRGSIGRLERLPGLGLESVHDFTSGFRIWHSRGISRVASKRAEEIFKENGIDKDTELPMKDLLALIAHDPVIATSGRLWISNQQVTWKALRDRFHDRADEYLSEMEQFDKRGPGTLELNPEMDVPASYLSYSRRLRRHRVGSRRRLLSSTEQLSSRNDNGNDANAGFSSC